LGKMKKKNYKKRSIRDEIFYKIHTIDATRKNRILASERLYEFSKKWEVVFFCMNILAILFLISSILILSNSRTMIFISGFFSMYTIITQYYYNNLNYRERGLKFHYLELDLEEQILQLKQLLRQKIQNKELEKEYKHIMNNYLYSLKGYENHEAIDNEKRENSKKNKKYGKGKIAWTSDNIFYYGNIIVIIVFILMYLCNIIMNSWEDIIKLLGV
jgi:hypothetical protein